MKEFYEFDPLHPFLFEETVRVDHRKAYLSHIPLIDSVSIRGYLPVKTPSDVKSNTYWVDYRYDDGYRSANGEIIFDSSANYQFVDVSYLGVGTVLRAKDMNEVSTSLTTLEEKSEKNAEDLFNMRVQIGVVADNTRESLEAHEVNPAAHQTLIDSITAAKSEFEYRLNSQDSRLDGNSKLLTSATESLQSQIQNLHLLVGSQILETETRLTDQIDSKIASIDNYRDEFTGVYNQISRLEEKYVGNYDRALEKYESILAAERVSAVTAINNAKEEVLNRAIAEADRRDESIRADLDAQAEWEQDRRQALQDQIQTVETDLKDLADRYPLLQQIFEAEQRSRIQSDNSLQYSIESSIVDTKESIEGIRGDMANLADILYQARQATNTQLESLRANVAIAEENLLSTRRNLESITATNLDLNESLQEGLSDLDQMKSDMRNVVDEMFDPVRDEFDTSIRSARADLSNEIATTNESLSSRIFYVDAYFEEIEESVAAIWDEFEDVHTTIEEDEISIESAQNSIGSLALYDLSIVSSINTANSNITSINNRVNTANSNITTVSSSLASTVTRVTNLEAKHNPLTLGTASSTVNGAIWYS